MPLATRGRMLRRPLAFAFAGSVCLSLAPRASAGGAWLPSGGQEPVEQRVAVAVGPDRTTLWTSLRFGGTAGPVGLVVPVPPLSAIDVSSDAWLEALEVATAPRIFPPEGVDPYCPGESGDPDPFHVAGKLGHEATIAPTEVAILPDAGEVALWAASNGLSLAPELAAELAAIQGKRFLAARFGAADGGGLTKTLRVVMPGGSGATLPLALTHAGASDLLVTTWFIGPGRAVISGATPVDVDEANLTWNAKTLETDYDAERLAALAAAAPSGALLENASHEALSHNLSIGTSGSIEGVTTTYFDRANGYGDATGDPATCTALAAAKFTSASTVAASCPRADHGVVDGTDTCTEAPQAGQIDPDELRCGLVTDDLAVALSGLSPVAVWLSRYSLRIGADHSGADWLLDFTTGPTVHPDRTAETLSVAQCGGADAGPDGSSSSSSTSSGGNTSGGNTSGGNTSGGNSSASGVIYHEDYYPAGNVGCDCSGTADTVVVDDPETEEDEAEYTAEDDGCSGDSSSDSSAEDDGCSGDSSDSYSDESDDGCSSDTTDSSSDDGSDSCDGGTDSSGSGSSDDCSGDSSSGSSGDSCSSDSGGSSGCDSGGSSGGDECSIAGARQQGARKKRMSARLSPITLAALALLAPIRRLRRPKRGGRKG